MAANLTRLTHKIAIQLHLVAESCSTICSSSSRRPFRKLLDTPSSININVWMEAAGTCCWRFHSVHFLKTDYMYTMAHSFYTCLQKTLITQNHSNSEYSVLNCSTFELYSWISPEYCFSDATGRLLQYMSIVWFLGHLITTLFRVQMKPIGLSMTVRWLRLVNK
jgi:hypothetical protein